MGGEQESIKNELMKMELELLREEILHIQKCQVDFLVVSITTTAIIFGYVMTVFKQTIPNSVSIEALNNTTALQYSQYNLISQFTPLTRDLYLIPLCIILPVWCIVIYKARTVNRMRAYIMVLENLCMNNRCASFIGWENSMNEYRKKYNIGMSDIFLNFLYISSSPKEQFERIKLETRSFNNKLSLVLKDPKNKDKKADLRTSLMYKLFTLFPRSIYLIFPFRFHGYWELINSIFFWVTFLCLILSEIKDNLNQAFNLIIILVVAFISFINIYSVYDLAYGNNTTLKLGERWTIILGKAA